MEIFTLMPSGSALTPESCGAGGGVSLAALGPLGGFWLFIRDGEKRDSGRDPESTEAPEN